MTHLLIESDALGRFILLMILVGIVIPVILFIFGLVTLRKNKKRGKVILIIATIYSLISLGICGGLGL